MDEIKSSVLIRFLIICGINTTDNGFNLSAERIAPKLKLRRKRKLRVGKDVRMDTDYGFLSLRHACLAVFTALDVQITNFH